MSINGYHKFVDLRTCIKKAPYLNGKGLPMKISKPKDSNRLKVLLHRSQSL